MAEIKVPLEADYEAIALAAGAAPGTAMYWNDGTVKVPGVTKRALTAALKKYDHAAVVRRRKVAEAESNPASVEDQLTAMQGVIDKQQSEINALMKRTN